MKTVPLINSDKVALVDDEDYELVSRWHWRLWSYPEHRGAKGPYVVSTNRPYQRMHTLIMQPPYGYEPDHIDRDGLNNQRSNLRNLTHAENAQNLPISERNTSGFRGVSLHTSGLWRARVYVNRRCHLVGYFRTKEEAGYAAKCAREKLMPFSEN